jgi:hypothetical protein
VPDDSVFRLELSSLGLTLRQLIYPELKRIYPNARIVHVGYPRITPGEDEPTTGCDWLSDDEQNAAEEISRLINQTIERAASSTPGIEFLDVTDVLKGFELCTEHPWVNEISIAQYLTLGNTEQGHPTYDGQLAYMREVASRLRIEIVGP